MATVGKQDSAQGIPDAKEAIGEGTAVQIVLHIWDLHNIQAAWKQHEHLERAMQVTISSWPAHNQRASNISWRYTHIWGGVSSQ